MNIIKDFDPAKGMAFQGDVAIIPVPHGWRPSTVDEISPRDGRLILQEGEISNHHHAIYFLENIPRFHDTALSASLETKVKTSSARLYRDPELTARMASAEGPLTRADLVIGFLVVEGTPVIVAHEEHDGIRLPVGVFYIGHQIESAGAEGRVVRD